MAIALIGLQSSGGAGEWPRLQRVVNATTSVLGESFGTVTLPVAPIGTFIVGETLAFSGGGTATLTQAPLAGPNRLVIAGASGVIAGIVTGVTSRATAIVTSVEGAFTHPTADSNQFTNAAIEYGNRVFCLHGNTIYRLNESLGSAGGRCEEVYRLPVTRANYLSDAAVSAGMFVVYNSGVPTLLAFYTPCSSTGGVVRLRSTDGVAWQSAALTDGGLYFTTDSAGPGVVFNNNIHWVGTTATSGNAAYDTATDTFSAGPSSPFPFDARVSHIFTSDNRLFALCLSSNGASSSLMEIVGGSWVGVHEMPAAGASARMCSVPGNDGATYLMIPQSLGYRAYRSNDGALTEVTRGVLPAGLYTGTGVVTNGWCVEAFTGKEHNDATVDDGAAETFVYVSSNDSFGTSRTCYRWNDDVDHQHVDVRAASVVALPENTAAGSGVGKTLTSATNSALVVDGVPLASGDRLLVGGDGANSGIYTVTDQGSFDGPWVLTRAADFDEVSASGIATGAWVFVTDGTVNAGFRYMLSTSGPIAVDETPLAFSLTPILVLQNSGCPQQVRLPSSTYCGGEYTFSSGGLDIRITGLLPIPGGERVSFRIFKTPGAPNVTNLKARVLYRVATDDTKSRLPGKWGYIGASSAGTISDGNRELTSLTADSEQGSGGGTVYTLDWLAISKDLLSNYLPIGRKLVVYA